MNGSCKQVWTLPTVTIAAFLLITYNVIGERSIRSPIAKVGSSYWHGYRVSTVTYSTLPRSAIASINNLDPTVVWSASKHKVHIDSFGGSSLKAMIFYSVASKNLRSYHQIGFKLRHIPNNAPSGHPSSSPCSVLNLAAIKMDHLPQHE